MLSKKFIRGLLICFILLFLLLNTIAYFHAYKFTHFDEENISKTKDVNKLSLLDKMMVLCFGVSNPRPVNTKFPAQPYEKVIIESNKNIECWFIKPPNAKGTVVIFHGYGGHKSSMLDKSDEFLKLGYNTLLVDFMGSGGSEGIQTTIGFKEAEEVKSCYDYLIQNNEKNIVLFGTSMGAAAILKAINDYKISPSKIVLECPFGSMYETTAARFRMMHVPAFPMAALLDFWGGAQNGFWAFGHNPTDYAKKVHCPALLLYGEMDIKVSRREIDEIYTNLAGVKELKLYPQAGHENYLLKYRSQWVYDVKQFLQ